MAKKRFLFFCVVFLPGMGLFPQEGKPDALMEYRNGNYEQAVTICRREITDNSRSLDSYVVICWSLISLRRYQEALNFARAGREISRYDTRIIEILGEIEYYEGHNREALQYFQEYIGLAPDGQRVETVYYFMGEIYIRLGRFRHADIALTTAIYRRPENAMWWTRTAYARENAGDLREAITAYEKALGLNPQLNDARRGLERARQALSSR